MAYPPAVGIALFSSKNLVGAIAWFPLRTESEHNQIALVAILPNAVSKRLVNWEER
ncbi:hypothetical protein H1Q63_06610 [Desmonostoc muscorum CCALA 125]|nr:hypothetical protein [Desmonostoc muscorum CCALA 125]